MNSLIDSMPLGVWFPWKECFSAMDAASDLAESSINWMLKRSVIAGFLEMRGEKKRGTDTRELRLIELP